MIQGAKYQNEQKVVMQLKMVGIHLNWIEVWIVVLCIPFAFEIRHEQALKTNFWKIDILMKRYLM